MHAPLLPLAVCLMAGIGLSNCLDNWLIGLCLLTIGVIGSCLLGHWPRLQTISIWACMLLLGMTVGARSRAHVDVRRSNHPAALNIRQHLIEQYRQSGLSEEAYGIVVAMTLGEKSQLDSSLKDTYAKVGAAHILALSGLHLMIIYAVISLFIGWRRLRLLSQVVIVAAIWIYAFMVGMSPSVVRSAFMISIYALLSLGHRERMSVNTLALTAIVMLMINPRSLYDISFQLSLMAVFAILLFYPLFARIIPLHVLQRHRWLNALWGMTTVSVSAQMGTAPLIAYYFGRFSTWFLLSNFVVVPLATVIIYLALACMLTFWWSGVQHVLAWGLSGIVVGMNRLLEGISLLPYSSIEGLHPSVWQVALTYIIIGSCYVFLSKVIATSRLALPNRFAR